MRTGQAIAAAFKPIPKLESYIGAQFRSGGIQVHITEPVGGSRQARKSGAISFRCAGTIEGGAPEDAGFNLLIFSNNRQDFEAFRPLISEALNPGPDGAFLVARSVPINKGLFYLIIEDQNSGEWMFVDKFFVED